MVTVTALWLPILVSAILVFVASSILHMVLPFHRGDLKKVPQEDDMLDALRRFNLPPGDYGAPMAGSMAAMHDPQFIEKMKRGPLVLMTVSAGGSGSMTKNLVQWFLYSLLVGTFAAVIASDSLMRGADYWDVCNFVAVTAFMGYSLALLQQSIWGRRSWVTTAKTMFDGAIYAVITGEVFAWLWPS